MKKTLIALVALCALAGCRREDIREYEFPMPQLSAANQQQARSVLLKYDGVSKAQDGIVFDLEKKTVKVRYDSMKIARANILYELEAVK